ncbi:MAG: DMT family transporter [Desulfurispora sp.]|uniref:DMT family transporter n=1 Tax=Desulfurispora sp. TaxID=3014275 RepID=UPI0040498DD5
MIDNLPALLIAAASGVLMAWQGTFNAVLGKKIGLLETTLVVHVTGLVLVSLLLFVLRLGSGRLALLCTAPWYTLLGGVLGVGIVYLVALSIPRVGVAPATTAIILGQVFTAGLIDHFGFCGVDRLTFSWCRIVGTLLMALGAYFLLRK